uniref:Secreted protein n=1 Tax=Trypanosoma congolense (strain IL3000) TaxID=1068625 RepID=G0ULR4_TRYCI|nr:hypothetical protein, unlikely [Trypanosoma congolense IL3000]
MEWKQINLTAQKLGLVFLSSLAYAAHSKCTAAGCRLAMILPTASLANIRLPLRFLCQCLPTERLSRVSFTYQCNGSRSLALSFSFTPATNHLSIPLSRHSSGC